LPGRVGPALSLPLALLRMCGAALDHGGVSLVRCHARRMARRRRAIVDIRQRSLTCGVSRDTTTHADSSAGELTRRRRRVWEARYLLTRIHGSFGHRACSWAAFGRRRLRSGSLRQSSDVGWCRTVGMRPSQTGGAPEIVRARNPRAEGLRRRSGD
jgi:hypothetical protein